MIWMETLEWKKAFSSLQEIKMPAVLPKPIALNRNVIAQLTSMNQEFGEKETFELSFIEHARDHQVVIKRTTLL